MSIQCPACLEDNPLNTDNCLICGYSLLELKYTEESQENPIITNNYSPHHLKPNTLLANGRYQITETLGEGGFGITYKGIYLANKKIIAIKELWPEKSARVDNNVTWSFTITPKEKQLQINKFKLEAQKQQECIHTNIPKVYDYFEENNTVYIVMEFIEGISLLKILKNEGVLSEKRAKKYFIQIAETLKVIHQNNLLHRDIKPENIIINHQDNAVVIDFGAAKEFIDGMTSGVSTILTPGYAPYEQYSYKSKRYAATDLYALCASMYELLTGKLPVEAPERVQSIYQKNSPDPLESIRKIRPEISSFMDRIICTGMKIKVEERFQKAEELITALTTEILISPLHKKAREFVKKQTLDEAINTYNKCLENEPENVIVIIELALIQTHTNPQEAEITANRGIKLGSSDARLYGIIGLLACHQQNWQKAVSDLQKASQLSPQQGWIYINLAWALGKTKQWELAQKAINYGLSLNTDNKHNTFALGLQAWILIKQKQWKQAIPPATQAIFKSKQANNAESQQLQKWVYPHLILALKNAVITKNALDVERKIDDFCQNNPDSSYVWGLKAWQSAKAENWQQALTFSLKATSLSNTPSWILINFGIIYEHLNQIEKAINIYQECEQQLGNNHLVYYRLGSLFIHQQKWDKAHEYLEKALKTNPNSAEINHNLGAVLLNWKKQENEEINSNRILSFYSKAVRLYAAKNSNYGLKLKTEFNNKGLKLL